MAQRPPRMPRRNTPNPGEQEPEQSTSASTEAKDAPREGEFSAPRSAAHDAEPATDALDVISVKERASRLPKIPKPSRPAAPQKRKPAAEDLPQGRKTNASNGAAGRRAKPEEPSVGGTSSSSRPAPGSKQPLRERAKQKQNERRREDRAKFSMAVRRKPGEKPADNQPVEQGQPVAAHRFSGRIAALIVVFGFFAVMLVPTVNYYRTQMAEISDLRASIASMEAQRDELKAEIARWDDPLYIKQQARERINLVMPGEKLYMVVGDRPEDQKETETGNGSTYEVRQELPWVDALMDSVHRSATD